MKRFDIALEMESASLDIERANAILTEASQYFESTDEASRKLLPFYADHILLLMDAAHIILHNTVNALNNTVQIVVKEKNNGETN